MVLFNAENDPTRVHHMQVWKTPFVSEEFAASAAAEHHVSRPHRQCRTGARDFQPVRPARDIGARDVSASRYELLAHATRRLFDAHHWIDDAHSGGLATLLRQVAATGESVLDEFQKVLEIRRQADEALRQAQSDHRALFRSATARGLVAGAGVRRRAERDLRMRSRLLTIRDYRPSIPPRSTRWRSPCPRCARPSAPRPARSCHRPRRWPRSNSASPRSTNRPAKATTAKQAAEHIAGMQAMSADLDMLSELMASKVDDATQRTQVVEALSGLYARLNQGQGARRPAP